MFEAQIFISVDEKDNKRVSSYKDFKYDISISKIKMCFQLECEDFI
jgi:hypothetical protein